MSKQKASISPTANYFEVQPTVETFPSNSCATQQLLGMQFVEDSHYLKSQNISSWKGPIGIMESNSLLLARLPKTKSYD